MNSMRTSSENYKGIEYVQISSLPTAQKNVIWKSINLNLIITILKEDALLNDCLQYQHYLAWYENAFKLPTYKKPVEEEVAAHELVFAFK